MLKAVAGALAAVLVTLVALTAGALLMNRLPLGDPPGPMARLRAYLASNVAETRAGSPFPELRPRSYAAPAAQIHRAAREACRRLGWEDLHEDVAASRLQAVARTLVWRFADDVSVHVEASGPDRALVHVRSASRLGSGDLGTNTRHVLDFFAELDRVLAERRVPTP